MAGRETLAVRWVVVDLLVFVAVAVGSAIGASGSLTLVAAGSVGVVAAGVVSGTTLTVVASGLVTGTAVAGAAVTGCVAAGAVWARSWVEESARTAAIAVMAGAIFGFLWLMIRVNERLATTDPSFRRSGP